MPEPATPHRPRDAWAAAGFLALLNAWLCWPLFRIEYLDQLQSNEGTFIAFGRFLLHYWPHVRWFPWFNCGMPYESTYLPLVPALAAIGARLTGWSVAHALHFTAALAYSLAPVTLFLFARKLSNSTARSFLAALLWSLVSTSALIPAVRADMGATFGLRRLQTAVYYGEVPHNLSICLFPLALLAVIRWLESPRTRTFAVAAAAVAAVLLCNAFGAVAVVLSSVMLLAVYHPRSWRKLPSLALLLLAGYLLVCRLLPPSVLSLIQTNAQLVGGDYRFTTRARLLGVAFFAILALLSRVLLRLPSRMLRFACLYLACFGGITVLAAADLTFLPQPARYHLEMEMGISLAITFALPAIPSRRAPRSLRFAAAALALAAVAWLAAADRQYALKLVRPADVDRDVRIREARWIAAHLPGERVMASGEESFWFDDFSDNPQMGGGHEPTAPNWVQRVAVYTIYTGQNAGDRDGPVSVLWLKAFGNGAITVAGPASHDAVHAVRNPRKFDSLLPLAWREGDDSVYRVASQPQSLAHVIPLSAVVNHRPIHGLDTAEVQTYVAALEDRHMPSASLTWMNPERARVLAAVAPGQVLSIQMSYDSGWRASVEGRPVPIHTDRLGLTIVEPRCPNGCRVDLEFTEGPERAICSLAGLAMAALLAVMLAGIPAPAR